MGSRKTLKEEDNEGRQLRMKKKKGVKESNVGNHFNTDFFTPPCTNNENVLESFYTPKWANENPAGQKDTFLLPKPKM